ncbi:MAG: zinc ribbon domain-containing protein [Deltaproteobacteria bacterium]|nr:zinc ribbon domain-containing protein [Deltaproteobacteria bacterium]MBW1910378.1 zinc ribbon domain-containing protein [Deltaproteobacteria bacterium]MBW2033664.1 zinc ribbon domain-containing protein [Deltaproteobacteria bacterium]
MFFVIAGIQPRNIRMDDTPRMCPSCGLYQAHLKRVDQYFSFFFLPLLRIKKGIPFLECNRCGTLSRESGDVWSESRQSFDRTCPNCGKSVDPTYSFCPFCGQQL